VADSGQPILIPYVGHPHTGFAGTGRDVGSTQKQPCLESSALGSSLCRCRPSAHIGEMGLRLLWAIRQAPAVRLSPAQKINTMDFESVSDMLGSVRRMHDEGCH